MSAPTHPVPEEVMAFVDGQLSQECIESVSKHLEGCVECKSLAEQIRVTSQRVAEWHVGALPKKVETNVKAAMHNPGRISLLEKLASWNWAGPARAALVALVAVAVLFVVGTPNLLRSRMAGNEASAVGALRTLNTAATTYLATYGHYPPSLSSFGRSASGVPSEEGAGLIDDILARDGRKSGYLFTYRIEPTFGQGLKGGYSIKADPLEPGKGGMRHFSTNQGGIIFADGLSLDDARTPKRLSEQAEGDKTSSKTLALKEISPMIARTAELELRVEKIDDARRAMDQILSEHKGYIAQLSASDEGNSVRTVVASLRVPSSSLDECIAELKKLGRVVEESQKGEEVTQQHLDLSARINNARTTESKLNNITQQRTGKVTDVLEVEKEVARVRGDLEQMEAERQTLEHRVEFAAIDLRLSEEYKAQLSLPAPSVMTQIRNASVNGFRGAWESLLAIILFCAEAGPTLILWAAILFLPARLFWRRYQKAHATLA